MFFCIAEDTCFIYSSLSLLFYILRFSRYSSFFLFLGGVCHISILSVCRFVLLKNHYFVSILVVLFFYFGLGYFYFLCFMLNQKFKTYSSLTDVLQSTRVYKYIRFLNATTQKCQ